MEGNYETFVFYGSWRETLEGFKEDFGADYAKEALWNLMTLATAGDIETEKKSIIGFITGCVMPNIDAAKKRYDAAVENGKKGGRPKKIDEEEVIKLKGQGMKNREIAEKLGCSESSIEKINAKTRKNQKNLEKEIEEEKEKEIEEEKEIEKRNSLISLSGKSATLEDSKMSNVKYIYSKPIEEEDAAAAKIQKQIQKAQQDNLYDLLYEDVDEDELAAATTFDERKKALGF